MNTVEIGTVPSLCSLGKGRGLVNTRLPAQKWPWAYSRWRNVRYVWHTDLACWKRFCRSVCLIDLAAKGLKVLLCTASKVPKSALISGSIFPYTEVLKMREGGGRSALGIRLCYADVLTRNMLVGREESEKNWWLTRRLLLIHCPVSRLQHDGDTTLFW